MSIRPVDMQIVVQKTQEIHSAKQNVVNKVDNELIRAQMENKEQNVKKHQMVNEMERSELNRVKNDSKGNSKNKKKNEKESRDNEGADHASAETNTRKNITASGTHFDMKV